jgi:hypothetical protein
MIGLFENLEEIKPRKEKVSAVGPFLSVVAQKHWQNFRVKIRDRVVATKYFARVGIMIGHSLFAYSIAERILCLIPRFWRKQPLDGGVKKVRSFVVLCEPPIERRQSVCYKINKRIRGQR